MKFDKSMMKLYAITDRSWSKKKTLYDQVHEALLGGATCIQLREKNLNFKTFLEEAKKLVLLCHSFNVPLIINDNVEIAQKSLADGVHLGQDDQSIQEARKILGENAIIGVSCHTVEEARQACQQGANYLGAGAIFTTSTKSNTIPMTKETLIAICKEATIPVVAIGGIKKEKLDYFKDTHIAGVALVSAIFNNPDIQQACIELNKILDEIL